MVFSSPQVQLYEQAVKLKDRLPWTRILGDSDGANLSELTEDDLNGYVDNGIRLFRSLPDVASLVDPLYLSDIDVGYCSTMVRPVVRGLANVYRSKSVRIMKDPFSKNTLIYLHFAVDDLYLQSGYSYEAFVKLDGTFEAFVGRAEATAVFLITREGIPVFLNFKADSLQNTKVYRGSGLPSYLSWLTKLALRFIFFWKREPIRKYIQRFGYSCLSYAMKQGIKDLLLLMEPLYLPGIYYGMQKIQHAKITGIYKITLVDKVTVDLNRKTRSLVVTVRVSVRNIILTGEFRHKFVKVADGDFKIGVGFVSVNTALRISPELLPSVKDVKVDKILDISVIRASGRGVNSHVLIRTAVNSAVNSFRETVRTTLEEIVRKYVKRPLEEWANETFISLLEVNMKERMRNAPRLLQREM